MLDHVTRERLAALEGLIPEPVGLMLAQFASGVPIGRCIVEVGSYKGKSACYLAAGSMAGSKVRVFAVDPWDTPGNVGGRFGFDQHATREAFDRQVRECGFAHAITPLQGFSVDVASRWLGGQNIGLLYIDGSHTEKDVRADVEAWMPHLAPNGMIAFDDYNTPRNPGVKKVVNAMRQHTELGFRWQVGPYPLIAGLR